MHNRKRMKACDRTEHAVALGDATGIQKRVGGTPITASPASTACLGAPNQRCCWVTNTTTTTTIITNTYTTVADANNNNTKVMHAIVTVFNRGI
jgi:hypothetical protein